MLVRVLVDGRHGVHLNPDHVVSIEDLGNNRTKVSMSNGDRWDLQGDNGAIAHELGKGSVSARSV